MSAGFWGVALSVSSSAGGTLIAFLAKDWWTRRNKHKDEIEKAARTNRFKYLERQLSEFYWPLMVHFEKDNFVWEKMLDAAQTEDDKRSAMGRAIEESFILPNHAATVEIIEKHMHLAGAGNAQLVYELLGYTKHVAIYQAIVATRQDGDPIQFPKAYGANYPAGLFLRLSEAAKAIQTEYDVLIEATSPVQLGRR